jgi:hypothetical protein
VTKEYQENKITPPTEPFRVPYWPQKICEIAVSDDFATKDGNTVLIQIIKDIIDKIAAP